MQDTRWSALLCLFVTNLLGTGSLLHANGAPVVQIHVPLDGMLSQGSRVEVRIEVQDPDGDPLTIRSIDSPLGFTFEPRVQVPSPFTHTVDWRVTGFRSETGQLTITADDGITQTTATASYTLTSGQDPAERIHFGDVTGDGQDDWIVYSENGVYPTNDGPFGGVFVWEGGLGLPTTAPTISVHPPSNGLFPGTEIAGIRDVTGDGIDDVVILLRASLFPLQIWRGGGDLSTGAPPTVTFDAVTTFLDERVYFGDVTGDGVDDIVGLAGGDLYVWAGGSALSSRPAAQLFLPVVPGDGRAALGADGIYLADVTGDGLLDVLATGEIAPFSGNDGGAIYIWHGGPNLAGPTPPSATLYQPWGPQDSRTSPLGAFGFSIGDVTGDGIADVIERSFEDVYIWHGGPDLVGRRTAELWLRDSSTRVPSEAIVEMDGDGRNDWLSGGSYTRSYWSDIGAKTGLPDPDGSIVVPPDQGSVPRTPQHRLTDVDNDGTLDLVVLDRGAEHPVSGEINAGAVHVWYGGAGFLPGSPPDATLLAAEPVTNADLGETISVGDVTGDGFLDVVSSTRTAVYVWAGSATRFAGLEDSSARLAGVGSDVRLVDVTGDGIPEVVAYNDLSGGAFNGQLFVFRGGGDLIGQPAPILAVTGDPNDELTSISPRFADLDGDDVLDIVTGSPQTTVARQSDAGAIQIWRGGVLTPSPTFEMRRTVPVANDFLGQTQALALRDLTGDGLVDLVFGGPRMDVGGVVDVGALLFSSGFGPAVELSVPGASPGAQLGGR